MVALSTTQLGCSVHVVVHEMGQSNLGQHPDCSRNHTRLPGSLDNLVVDTEVHGQQASRNHGWHPHQSISLCCEQGKAWTGKACLS
jgi:hypothetical protein